MDNANTGFDLVIPGGRVMDPETGPAAVRNIGVTDGKIVEITTDAIRRKKTVEATGHVLAPGFLDCHVHTTDHPFTQKLMLRRRHCRRDQEVNGFAMSGQATRIHKRADL